MGTSRKGHNPASGLCAAMKTFCFYNKLVLKVFFFLESCAMLRKYLKPEDAPIPPLVKALWLHSLLMGNKSPSTQKKILQARSPLPLPNPAHLVFNIYKGSLSPFPTTWNLEFSSKAEEDMNLAHPLLAGPSASSFAKAWFQVQSLSTSPQWINLIKEEDRSQLLVLKPLSSYATVTPPAHAHGHDMKNHIEILLLQTHNNLWT